MTSVYEKISSALSSLGKRKEREPGNTPEPQTKRSLFRPWDQAGLHRRLHSYKPLNWFAKPTSVGPIPCACHGWVNEGLDTLGCEYCGSKLVYPPHVPYDQQQAAAGLFQPLLASKHTASCPWRMASCNESLLAYTPSNTDQELAQLFQLLQNKLLKIDVLPELDAIAIEEVRSAPSARGPFDRLVLGIEDEDEPGTISLNGHVGSDENAVALVNPPVRVVIQPSKLTAQQKTKLLALLGWDMDVLQADAASTPAASSAMSQSAGYSLQHLGVRRPSTKPSQGTATRSGAAAGGEPRCPMSSVVLKCPHCQSRMGLWNFAGARPVPTGRLLPSSPCSSAAPAAARTVPGQLPLPGMGTTAPASGDALSLTIAGGRFGNASTAAPLHRFGSGDASVPVFGLAALDAAVRCGSGSSDIAMAHAGDSFSSAAASAPVPAHAVGQKRKAPESDQPTPMDRDRDMADATPGPRPSGSTAAAGSLTPAPASLSPFSAVPKRQRIEGGFGSGSPIKATAGGSGSVGAGLAQAETQAQPLDPLRQHKNWCPWVFTGSEGGQRHTSGWQHMLQALDRVHSGGQPSGGVDGDDDAQMPDARQLRDTVMAAIKKL